MIMALLTMGSVLAAAVVGIMTWKSLPEIANFAPTITNIKKLANVRHVVWCVRTVAVIMALLNLFASYVSIDDTAWWIHLGWAFAIAVMLTEFKVPEPVLRRETQLRAEAEAPEIS